MTNVYRIVEYNNDTFVPEVGTHWSPIWKPMTELPYKTLEAALMEIECHKKNQLVTAVKKIHYVK